MGLEISGIKPRTLSKIEVGADRAFPVAPRFLTTPPHLQTQLEIIYKSKIFGTIISSKR